MTYEEKLDLLLNEILEARKRTRNKQPVKIFVTKESELFKKIIVEEIYELLLKLQDDEKILIIKEIPSDLEAPWQIRFNENNYFLIEILDSFDSWLSEYKIKQKSRLENLDWLNLLKILDVCLDIDQQIQMTRNATITIPSFPYPYIGRFLELFPYDSIGTRKSYQQYRWEGIQYLHKEGIALKIDYREGGTFDYGEIIIRVNPVKFDDFYKRIKAEFEKRKKSFKDKNKPETNRNIKTTDKKEIVWPNDFKWEGKKFICGKYGSISFTSKDRQHIFKILTEKRGGWATINELKGEKDPSYVRSTIKQIEDRLPKEAKKYIKIVSTKEDDSLEKPNQGAYRIKVKL